MCTLGLEMLRKLLTNQAEEGDVITRESPFESPSEGFDSDFTLTTDRGGVTGEPAPEGVGEKIKEELLELLKKIPSQKNTYLLICLLNSLLNAWR